MACGIFLNQGSNLCLLHCQAASLPLSHQRSPSQCLWSAEILGKQWEPLEKSSRVSCTDEGLKGWKKITFGYYSVIRIYSNFVPHSWQRASKTLGNPWVMGVSSVIHNKILFCISGVFSLMPHSSPVLCVPNNPTRFWHKPLDHTWVGANAMT